MTELRYNFEQKAQAEGLLEYLRKYKYVDCENSPKVEAEITKDKTQGGYYLVLKSELDKDEDLRLFADNGFDIFKNKNIVTPMPFREVSVSLTHNQLGLIKSILKDYIDGGEDKHPRVIEGAKDAKKRIAEAQKADWKENGI